MNCTFVTPYTNKEKANKWKAQLLKEQKGAKVILINGDAKNGGAKSFFDVWRQALPKIKTKYVCLTHDDTQYVAFPDLDKYMRDRVPITALLGDTFREKIGMIGTAGTTVLHKDQPWWFSTERFHGKILSGQIWNTEVDKDPSYSNFGDFGEVVVLDGVCMITTKEILEEVLPTCLEKDYGTWDFYDHIISLELIKRGYKLLTVPMILVHGSKGGDKRQSFFDSMDKFRDEYLDKTWRV